MSKTRFEFRQVIKKKWTQMTPGSETLTYGIANTILWYAFPYPNMEFHITKILKEIIAMLFVNI